jgi:CheY-like chemotaxis protein
MRIVICDDSALFRRGLTLLLGDVGVEVVDQARDAAQLYAALPASVLPASAPDAVILDIRMPPTFTDEGLTAAADLRRDHAQLGILVLSTYAETTYAIRLLEIGAGVGYLLKDRVDDATTPPRRDRTGRPRGNRRRPLQHRHRPHPAPGGEDRRNPHHLGDDQTRPGIHTRQQPQSACCAHLDASHRQVAARFVTNAEDPYTVVNQLRQATAPGSYLVISHTVVRGPR